MNQTDSYRMEPGRRINSQKHKVQNKSYWRLVWVGWCRVGGSTGLYNDLLHQTTRDEPLHEAMAPSSATTADLLLPVIENKGER